MERCATSTIVERGEGEMAAIELDAITVRFGATTAVDGVRRARDLRAHADVDMATRYITTADGWHSSSNDWYNCGNWVMNQRGPNLTDQWVLHDRWMNDDPNAKIRRGMIAWSHIGTGEVRIVGSHDSLGAAYSQYPQTTTSPDGRLVMWTSDMNLAAGTTTTRKDVFVARMPVSPLP